MNTHEPAGYRNFSLLGWTGLLTTSLKEVVHIASLLKEKHRMDKALEKHSSEDQLEGSGFTTGKSTEEIRVLRKEVHHAIQRSHIDLSEIAYKIARLTSDHPLDSEMKECRIDLNARLDHLIRELENNKKILAACDAAIAQSFARRRFDKKPFGQLIRA